MFEFREINDGKLWDEFACTFPSSTFINSYTWAEFQRSLGHEFKTIGIFKENDLFGLLPIKIIKAKRGRILHLEHAPLINWVDEDENKEIIEFLKSYGKQEKVWLVRISPVIENTLKNNKMLASFGLKPSPMHEVDAEHTLILDLSLSENDILKQMRKNTRYYINKAQKMGVVTEVSKDTSKFDIFWEIFIDAVERNKWVAYSKDYVYKEFKSFANKGNSAMFLSKYEGKYISAGIFNYFNGQSFYHHSGSLTEFRNIPTTYALQWESIKYAKNIGCREHNFWGVVDKTDIKHPWYGLSLFKYGFGGNERKSVHAHDLVIDFKGHITRLL